MSDRITVTAVAVLVGCAFGVGVLVTGALPLQVAVLIGVLLLAGAAGSAWMLAVRYGPTRGERNLALTIDAENRAGRELADAVAGSSWVLFHDRRLSARRASGVVHRRWSGGNSVDRDLPAGPYLILAPSGVKAGEDELAYGWLPARVWEARYLMRQLSNVGTAGLRFAGPVMPMAMEGYPRASKIPDGWSAQPPYRIDQFPIRRPAVLGQYLSYLPRIFAPHHVAQLAQLVDQHCPPAPEAPSATTSV
ncbi:MAG TPA: hypothetical protein VIT42_18145 [Microlunatus sp.]